MLFVIGPCLLLPAAIQGRERARLWGAGLVAAAIFNLIWFVGVVRGTGLFGYNDWRVLAYYLFFVPTLALGIAFLALSLAHPSKVAASPVRNIVAIGGGIFAIALLLVDLKWIDGVIHPYVPPPPTPAELRRQVDQLMPYLAGTDPARRAIAMGDLSRIPRPLSGSSIVPLADLIRQRQDLQLRDALYQDLLGAIAGADPQARTAAAMALGCPEPVPSSRIAVFGELLKETHDPLARCPIILFLRNLGMEALPAMMVIASGEHRPPTAAVGSGEPDLGWLGVYLEEMGLRAVPQILELANHPDPAVRATAAGVIGKLSTVSKEGFVALSPGFLKLMRDPHPVVRSSLLRNFSDRHHSIQAPFGVYRPLISPLLQALQDPDSEVRGKAADFLGFFSSLATPGVAPALARALGDRDYVVRQYAALSLGKMGRFGVPNLLRALQEGDHYLRQCAAAGLADAVENERVGSRRLDDVVQALQKAERDSDADVRSTVSESLKKIQFQLRAAAGTEEPAVHVAWVGGMGGGPFQDLAPRGGRLVGIRATLAVWQDADVIKSLVPLYEVRGASERGRVHGQPSHRVEETLARPGYAVGGLFSQGVDRVNGFRAVFMRITPEGLDPKDAYEGPWIGGRRSETDVYLGEDGCAVTGIAGREGADVDSLALLFDPNATLDPSPMAVTGDGFIARWLVAGPVPIAAEPVDPAAALTAEWIPNLASLTPAQHTDVTIDGSPFRWRVGNLIGHYLPLGFEDGSVSIAVSYIVSDRDTDDATLLTGSHDGALWFLNGREVQRFAGRRGLGKDQDRTVKPVALHKGVNVLAAIVVNVSGATAICARFVDASGRPLPVAAGADPRGPSQRK